MSGLKDIQKKSELEDQNNKEDNIPILLLSKDLINTIDSINENQYPEKEFEAKTKDINNNYFHSSESSNDEDLPSKEPEPESPIFSQNFFGDENDEKENTEEKGNNQKKEENIDNNIFPSILFQPPLINSFYQNSQKQESQENFETVNMSKNENQAPLTSQDKFFLPNKNNNFQKQKYFMNSCFTMNGRSGWICSECKNFNYESK